MERRGPINAEKWDAEYKQLMAEFLQLFERLGHSFGDGAI